MRPLLLLAAVTLAGCSDLTAPATTNIRFRLDAATCHEAHALAFLVDDIVVGRGLLAPGETSEGFPVLEGSHTASAVKATDPVFAAHVWAALAQEIGANQTYTVILACQ